MRRRMSAVSRTALVIAGLALWAPEAFSAGTVSGTVTADIQKARENVVVYLKGVKGPVMTKQIDIDQHHMMFNPRVSAIPVGSTAVFSNHDKIYHNVFSVSDAKKFNLDTYSPGYSKKVLFDKPGAVNLLCHVHPEMSGWIIVTENQYAAVTDDDGRFTIQGVPAGTYEVGVWSEKEKPEGTAMVSVTNGHTSQLVITLGK
jgi:plastocyanin